MSTKRPRSYNLRVTISSALLSLTIATTLYGCGGTGEPGSNAPTNTNQASNPSPTASSIKTGSSTQTTGSSQADAAHSDYAQSLRAFDQKDYATAIAELTNAIKLDPSVVEYYVQRALCYQLKGDGDNAIADYSMVIQMENNPATREQDQNLRQTGLRLAYGQIGEIYYKQGKYNQAITNYSTVISQGQVVPYIYEHRGDSYNAIGEKDKAIADYKTELDRFGNSGTPGVQYITPTEKQRLEQKIKDLGGSV